MGRDSLLMMEKVKLLVSKTSDSCFQGFDFFQMLLASHS